MEISGTKTQQLKVTSETKPPIKEEDQANESVSKKAAPSADKVTLSNESVTLYSSGGSTRPPPK